MIAVERVVAAPAETAPNPLIEGLERLPVAPCALVVFGATGDLAMRRLLPAIYNLAHEGTLPERFQLVGVARSQRTDEEFRAQVREWIRAHSRRAVEEAILVGLLGQMSYVGGALGERAVFARLASHLNALDERVGLALNRVFYLSTAPGLYAPIVDSLGASGLHRQRGAQARLVIEKPFGSRLAGAIELNRRVLATFAEPQVFRIDHYLGKETVQNLLAFRFANTLFEPLWNSGYVEHVQITAAEEIGIGTRAGYYEHSGALRDLVQNHLLQLLCLLCMEPPPDFSADAVRNEKVRVLEAMLTPTPERIDQIAVRGQYAPGVVGGEAVCGYLQEDGVSEGSSTETFAALRLEVANRRWAGVPFYLRTGKRLARKVTEIAVQLKPAPHEALRQQRSSGLQPNQLILHLQPNEGVSLLLGAKSPGSRMLISPVNMEFRYGTSFLTDSPDAYERLLLDAMRGDPTLFTRNDEIEAQWRICDPIISHWQQSREGLARYVAGTRGPAEADELLQADHAWRAI